MPYGKAWKWPWQCKKPQHMVRSLPPAANNETTTACIHRARAQLHRVVVAVEANAAGLSDRAAHRLGRVWNSTIHYLRRQRADKAEVYIQRFIDQAMPPAADSERVPR